MTSMKYVLGIAIVLLLTMSVFAEGSIFPQENLKESQVVITPADDAGKVLNISLLVFEPATSTSGVNIRDVMDQIAQECASAPDRQTCIQQKALERTASSRDYQLNLSSLQNAHFVVEYFNPQGNAYHGLWSAIPGCEDVIAGQTGTAYRPSPDTGEMVAVPYYFGQCDLTPVAGSQRVYIRATYVPQPTEDVSPSSAEYEYNNFNVTSSTDFAQNIQNFINGVSQSGGQEVGAGGALPCVGVFMILGLLLASLYFAGKSPISLLDITTPRLPTPKGVTAGGQILLPYGYTEMKGTAKARMGAAAAAVTESASRLAANRGDDRELQGLRSRIAADRGTAADRAAGDVVEGRKIATALVTAGRSLGMKGSELEHLARLPYHYGDAEHKTVAQIIEALEKRGGREALMAATLKDYLYGLRTFQSLEVLTAHPDVAQRSAVHYRVTSLVNKAFGANRYAVIGPGVGGSIDSVARTSRIMGRMGKAIVTEAPELARATARTTMQMIGGARAVEELEARGKASPTAAWIAGQLNKHPSQVIMGAMYPINDKMGKLYHDLRGEALHDEMRYVLRQIYKRMGVRFDVSEEELASMGHVDMDIKKRCNITSTAAMAAAEEEIRRVLSNGSMNTQDKLSALMRVAESHGAVIDHQMVNFTRRLEAIEASGQQDHLKMLMLQQALEEQNKVRMSVATGGKVSEDAYLCHVGGNSLRGHEVWEHAVLRTMIWDYENGYAQKGGIEQAAVRERLSFANRLATLDPTAAMEQLPEHMRNPTQLKAVAERNRQDLVSLFTDEGKQMFQQRSGKAINGASISEIVGFMYGGNLPRTGQIDAKSGRMHWWPSDLELGMPKNATLVDMKRHWVDTPKARENFAIAQWTESKFVKGHVSAYDPTIEAQMKRMPGYSSMTGEQESQMAKKLWIQKELVSDVEMRFNSQFAKNAYGTTRETMKFYGGIQAGFLEKALEEKRLPSNHPDVRFVQEVDFSNTKDLARFQSLMKKYSREYQTVASREMSMDEIAKSNKAVVLLQEGGYAYYKKGMVLSDHDRLMAGQAALRDDKGQKRAFVPEDVAVTFSGRDDLSAQYGKLRMSKDPSEWQSFVQSAVKWAKEGGYNYERERVLGAVLWEFGNKTHDYDSFWKHSAVTVEAKRAVAPVAPSVLRMFGVEAPGLMKAVAPIRNIAMAGGDYISKIAIKSGGPVLNTSYDVAAVGLAYRMQGFEVTRRIYEGTSGVSEKEAGLYKTYASKYGAYLQAHQWALDRSPFGYSTSHSTNAADAALFASGPGLTFKTSDYVGATMDKGTMASFRLFYAWPMDLARKIMAPYATAISTGQKEMMGRAGRFDTTGDPLRMLHHTEPRVRSAMQAFLNPLSLSSNKIAQKLNVWGGSAQRRQVGGEDVMLGLAAATQDISLTRKGVYVTGRVGDANPREKMYNARMEGEIDAPMAYELMKNATFRYQRDIYDAAHTNTTRRTVSAEALAIKRSQELMSFSSLQTPQGKFYSPIHFALHALKVPDIGTKIAARAKHGYGGSVGDSMRHSMKSMSQNAGFLLRPHMQVWEKRCPKCGANSYQYRKCASCGTRLW
jgi:hypothetical protein